MALPRDFEEFATTLKFPAPPPKWPEGLKSIWYDAKGDWHNAHELAQVIPSAAGSWIHAYLHRKEGDEYNARYWYGRANRVFPGQSLDGEHREIVEYLLRNI